MCTLHHRARASRPRIPRPALIKLIWAWLVVIVFTVYGGDLLAAPLTPAVALGCFALLFFTIVAASFGVVHEADRLAQQLGEPYGTLILTLSIVSIEVILIASVLLGPGEFPTIGRDAIFAVMMIIINLVMGICLIAGALRHGEQTYNAQGAKAYLGMIVLLTGCALVLPNSLPGAGAFSTVQAWTIAGITAALYGLFLALQMGRERRLFMQPEPGLMAIVHRPDQASDSAPAQDKAQGSTRQSSLLLLAMIVPIVLLAHHLAVVIDYGVVAAGAPIAVSGLLIAIIVFTPESLTAVKAALNQDMQRAINLCLGAFVSTVGLTVPAVLVIGLLTGKPVIMGISALETLLFALTVMLAMLSFGGQKTSVIQGALHLALFALYGFLLFGA
ncbi:calcium:proton antiporter [Bordetella avium]|uniref:calcium:proton antiporter n=1 Tax=Bordetella avium TaxID=521 RepID=UPI000E0BF3B9|nr:calcium:proton antiporter [Bordetella avium]AZY51497.1 calcium:proton antiporter [Bordetella avium]RIQ14648.1 calcium:proton antiporter [Bordetella avium]RIQ16758.1 calcium:proton antiporter [Bordetella avium]RIQ35092.1 calcium:proton antiporter [Bordetella avium]RIQ40994.1 calcium:proton antiporter [Bordetella avium]